MVDDPVLEEPEKELEDTDAYDSVEDEEYDSLSDHESNDYIGKREDGDYYFFPVITMVKS